MVLRGMRVLHVFNLAAQFWFLKVSSSRKHDSIITVVKVFREAKRGRKPWGFRQKRQNLDK